MSTTMTATKTSTKIPPSNNDILPPHTPVENNDAGNSPIIRSTSKLGMFSVVSSRDSPVILQRASSLDHLASYSAESILLNNSLPNLENNSPYNNSPNSSPKPLRSAMSSRTLHESLHRGLSSNDTFSKSENSITYLM